MTGEIEPVGGAGGWDRKPSAERMTLVVDDVAELRFRAKPERYRVTALTGVRVETWAEQRFEGLDEVLVVIRPASRLLATGVAAEFVAAVREAGAADRVAVNTTAAPVASIGSALAVEDDVSLAMSFIVAQQHGLRYVVDAGRWLVWDVRVWTGLYDERSERPVKGLLQLHLAQLGRERAKEIVKAAEEKSQEDRDKAYAKAVKVESEYRSTRRLHAVWSAVEVRAAVSPVLRIQQKDLNRNPELLNCQNGMVSLRTGELLPHDPVELCTAVSPYCYRTDEPVLTPTFDRFLRECHPGSGGVGDEEMVAYLQRRSGLCAYGAQRSHVFGIDLGNDGRNGKGRFAEVLCAVLGDYAMTARSEILLITRAERHLTQIASLVHRRFVWVDETRASRSLDGAQVKMLTGGAPLRANFMRQDEFSFVPQFTMVLTTNESPKFEGSDRALGARLQIVPWEVSFTGREDEDLLDKLKAEGDGILAWLVRGAYSYLVGGLAPPEAVVAMTEEERAAHDPTGAWFEQHLSEVTTVAVVDGIETEVPDWHAFVSTDWLYEQYVGPYTSDVTPRSFSMRLGSWLGDRRWNVKVDRRSVGGQRWRGWVGLGFDRS